MNPKLYLRFRALALFCFLCISFQSFSQQNHETASSKENPIAVNAKNFINLTSFSERQSKVSKEQWLVINKDQSQHPELGQEVFNAPEKGLVEIFSKRTENTSYFVNPADPDLYYLSTAYGAINYQDNKGFWRRIDSRLSPTNASLFEATNQPNAVGLDKNQQHSYIQNEDGEKIFFNQWQLYGQTNNGRELLALADWSHFTAGDDGIYVTDIFPGIDAELHAGRGSVKTNFIVKQNNFASHSALIFADKFSGKENLRLQFEDGNSEIHAGDVLLNQGKLEIKKGHYYADYNPGGAQTLDYILDENELSFAISTAYLNQELSIGRVIIDPLVTASNSLAGNTIMTMYNASCSAAYSCDYSMVVNIPAGTTVTSVTELMVHRFVAPCASQDLVFGAGANNSCYTYWSWGLPTNSVGTFGGNLNFTPHLAACIPAPSCSTQSVTFNYRLFRRCVGPAGCDGSCIGGHVNYPWTVTVSGRTVEIDTITGNPSHYCSGETTALTATYGFGVPPYTVNWSLNSSGTPSIGSGNTINYLVPAINSKVYAIITDACNNTYTDSIAINLLTPRLYVDGSATTSGDGSTWGTAINTLSEALNIANRHLCVDEIWVKSGTYYPMDTFVVATSRDSSFRISRNGLEVYGGFAGTESVLSQRNIAANPTILSGDINVSNDSTDNCYHVVTVISSPGTTIDSTTKLDGFTITGGNADGNSSKIINGVTVIQADGGGMLVIASGNLTECSPLIQNCTIRNNYAGVGGGIYNRSVNGGDCYTIVNNCIITQNNSIDVGGVHSYSEGMESNSYIKVTNSQFLNNNAITAGAMAVYALNAGHGQPSIENCVFDSNTATNRGGVLFTYSGTITASNSIFTRNAQTNPASNGGGGVAQITVGQGITFNNCTFFGNTAASTMYSNSNAILCLGNLDLNNSIVWGNEAEQIANFGTNLSNFSNVKGLVPFGTNISSDPVFQNTGDLDGADDIWGTPDDGLKLISYSPSINAGSNALIQPLGLTTDLAGDQRIQQTIVDMGAYENLFFCPTGTRLYVDSNKTSSGDGTSWATAMRTVWEALKTAHNCTGIEEIWVAKGTYFPMVDQNNIATNRDSAFNIYRNGIKLYGGFAGTENQLSQRNVSTNLTVLSGERGLPDSSDNFYKVMNIISKVGETIDTNTVVDGFTITKGNAYNGPGAFIYNGKSLNRQDAGAIRISGDGANTSCGPVIANCKIVQNAANYGGGIYSSGYGGGNATPIFKNVEFDQNSAHFEGGGIFIAGSSNGSVETHFTDCSFSNNYSEIRGGGIYFNGSSSGANLYIENCNFNYNSQLNTTNNGYLGGAIFAWSTNSKVFVNNSDFEGNIGNSASAIANWNLLGLIIDSTTFTANKSNMISNRFGTIFSYNNSTSNDTITNSTFTHNSANTGGGIEKWTGQALIKNCLFQYDTVAAWGAAIRNGGAATISVEDCDILDNYGGVVGAIDQNNGTFNFTNTVFANNKSENLGGAGNVHNGIGNFNQCVFINNKTLNATGDGGGAIHSTVSTLNFNNCTFNDNTTASSTAPNSNAIAVEANGTVNLNNSIVWGSAANQIGNLGTINYDHSLIKTIPMVSPNLNTDPKFINPTNAIGADNLWRTGDDGLRLSPCSPAINAGSNALIPSGITQDFASATRIQNTTVDMGAYEMPYNFYGFPQVSQTMNATNPICANSNITFTASATSTGTTYSYQWYKNNTAVGTNSSTYTNNNWTNNDTVFVVFTNLECGYVDTSNFIGLTVLPAPLQPGVISGNASPCVGSAQVYSVVPVANAASYTWTLPSGWTGTSTTNTINVTVGSISGNITVTATNACGTSTQSNLPVTADPVTTPSVSITSSTPSPICAGTGVTFTASPTNGGTTPGYQWKVNGSNVGNNSATYTTTTLNNGDVVSVVMTVNKPCTTAPTATSNTMTYVVNPLLVPAVNIVSNAGAVLCQGTNVQFTASPTNGGPTPVYQWKLNGTNVGSNSPTFSTSLLNNGDVVTVVMSTSEVCFTTPTATSNALTMTVTPMLTPELTISSNAGNPLCSGINTTFTATPTNGGGNPVYQWKLNGVNVGSNSPTFSTTTLATGDKVMCVMTSSYPCLHKPQDSSNVLTMTVVQSVTPTIFVSSNAPANTTCEGELIHFFAGVTHAGNNPIFSWMVNGVAAGTNSPDYFVNHLQNGDVVTCHLQSNAVCKTLDTAFANSITQTVHPKPQPVIMKTGNQLSCVPANFVTYQWFLNTASIGGATQPTHLATVSGQYRVHVIDANGCENTSEVVIVEASTGMPNTTSAEAGLKIYPNPTQDVVYIEAQQEVEVVVININGQEIKRERNARAVKIGEFADGLYLFMIYDTDGNILKKVRVVKREE